MQYTIKKSELAKLAAAREIQTREAAESYFRETGFILKSSSPAMSKDWARVRFVNGSTFELAVPVGKLAAWSKFIPATRRHLTDDGNIDVVAVSDEMEISFDSRYAGKTPDRVTLRCGGSQISACCTGESSDEPAKEWAGKLGAAIPVIAPECGGEFLVQAEKSMFNPNQDVVAAMKAQRKAASAVKKDAKRRGDFARARQAEKLCLSELKNGAADYVAAMGTLAGGIAGEISRQKLVLKARRMLRRSLATPEIMPAWLPSTYQQTESSTETVFKLDDCYNPIVRELWRDDYEIDKAAHAAKCKMDSAVAEYVGESYTAPVFEPEPHHLERDEVRREWQVTADARAEFAGLVVTLTAAQDGFSNYKPRKPESTARYVSHRRGYQKPLLKQDKLAITVKTATDDLKNFIREMFSRNAERNGLPANIGSEYFTPDCDYSRARITARNWPERKGEIVTRFIMARDERMMKGRGL